MQVFLRKLNGLENCCALTSVINTARTSFISAFTSHFPIVYYKYVSSNESLLYELFSLYFHFILTTKKKKIWIMQLECLLCFISWNTGTKLTLDNKRTDPNVYIENCVFYFMRFHNQLSHKFYWFRVGCSLSQCNS